MHRKRMRRIKIIESILIKLEERVTVEVTWPNNSHFLNKKHFQSFKISSLNHFYNLLIYSIFIFLFYNYLYNLFFKFFYLKKSSEL